MEAYCVLMLAIIVFGALGWVKSVVYFAPCALAFIFLAVLAWVDFQRRQLNN